MTELYRVYYTGRVPIHKDQDSQFSVEGDSYEEALENAIDNLGFDIMPESQWQKEKEEEQEELPCSMSKDEADSIRGDEEYHKAVDDCEDWVQRNKEI